MLKLCFFISFSLQKEEYFWKKQLNTTKKIEKKDGQVINSSWPNYQLYSIYIYICSLIWDPIIYRGFGCLLDTHRLEGLSCFCRGFGCLLDTTLFRGVWAVNPAFFCYSFFSSFPSSPSFLCFFLLLLAYFSFFFFFFFLFLLFFSSWSFLLLGPIFFLVLSSSWFCFGAVFFFSSCFGCLGWFSCDFGFLSCPFLLFLLVFFFFLLLGSCGGFIPCVVLGRERVNQKCTEMRQIRPERTQWQGKTPTVKMELRLCRNQAPLPFFSGHMQILGANLVDLSLSWLCN